MKKSMRGRALFFKYRNIIKCAEIIFCFFPHPLKECIWSFSESWRGKLGLVLRYVIARTSARSCGDVVFIGPHISIICWEKLEIGSNVSIHRDCYLDATGEIRIGDNVSIAHQTSLLSTNHTYSDPSLPIRENPTKLSPIIICSDVWIACGCRILAGVTIRSRSIIAAGAVVTKNVHEGTIVGGVPAKKIKSIDSEILL